MNKPATKEPSMDEILSSIRQIIADDDSGMPPARPSAASPVPVSTPPFNSAPAPSRTNAPFALSPSQMLPPDPEPFSQPAEPVRPYAVSSVEDEADDAPATFEEPMAALVDPEDIAFESDAVDEEAPPPPPPEPVFRRPPPPAPSVPEARRPARSAAPVSRMAPMPDPTLSEDLAEQLLEPTAEAAVQGNLARLSSISAMASGQTVEGMMRELLRPMLKGWLDENLPAIVERMVEKEISRISRGVK